jgi:hypothetical protein
MIINCLKKAGLLISVFALTWAFSEKTGVVKNPVVNSNGVKNHRVDKKVSDSLKVLSVILQSEFGENNQVFVCKKQSFADSLVHSLCDEASFKRAISDSSMLQEIKSSGEFDQYWKKVEAENGMGDLRSQLDAEDVDKTLIPKAYALDSSVVIYPGWIIMRKK